MYRPEQFLRSYLVDHHYYKVVTIKNIIDQYDELKESVLSDVGLVEDDKYIDSLRAEIRATYYHAIETLFELIFALSPRKGIIDNSNIWYFLSTSSGFKNYKRIEEIAGGDTEFLDTEVIAGKKENGEHLEVPFGQYLFYFGITNPEVVDLIPESLSAIKDALIILAKEFSDRDEYNALKHGMRIFPTVKDVHVKASKEDEWTKLVDMSGSMSYLMKEKDESLSVHVVPMDTERDVRMTMLCSGLISNIIRTRRAALVDESPTEIFLVTLDDEILKEYRKPDKPLVKFRFNLKPVDLDEGSD